MGQGNSKEREGEIDSRYWQQSPRDFDGPPAVKKAIKKAKQRDSNSRSTGGSSGTSSVRQSAEEPIKESMFMPSLPNSPNDRQVFEFGPQGEDQSPEEDETVPTLFRWRHGGKMVYITGTFNNWRERIPLRSSHEEFATIIDLPVGTHHYKYIVDDEFKVNPDTPTIPDQSGTMNNYIVIQKPNSDELEEVQQNRAGSPEGEYGQEMPNFAAASAKAPPTLPPHLLQVILNSDPVTPEDPTLLPVPNHVMLNHLYALSVKDGVMVLGVTHRYRKKYVTTVFYKPVSL
eukprot:Clim_evm10s12 gene=Clim_evmTU10s12